MTKAEIHAQAKRQFDRIQEALYEERMQSLEDRRFYSIAGAQWEGKWEEEFENKPRLEVNKVHLAVIKIINEYRNNRITVDFISKDGSTDDELADTCDSLFRADEQDSRAEEAYDNAFEEAVGGGFGAFRLITEYEDEEDEDNDAQRIRIEPIYDADSCVFFDLDAKRQDKADAKYCYVVYSQTPEDFKEEWGKEPVSIQKIVDKEEYDWFSPDLVYFAEYYKVEMVKHKVFTYSTLTGEEEKYTEEDFEENPELEAELTDMGMKLVKEKTVKKRKVHKYVISGNEILDDCGYIAGSCIPIVPTYGKRWMVESVERVMGHVRLVKDVQRLKNMLMSKLAEISAQSTVEKPILVPQQVAGHEIMWSEDTVKNYPYLLLEPLIDPSTGAEQPVGPIAYTKPPQVPPALGALMQLVDIDQKELLGGTGEADKMLSHVSGKAHELIQKRIDGQAYIYMSNFAKSIRRAGEIWLGMAKDVYVEKGRKMKAIAPMGQISQVELMQPGLGPDGEVTEKNDLTKASFDVWVDVGPSSDSQREATVQSLLGMMQFAANDQQMMQVLTSLTLLNMEGEGLAETREYFRKQLVEMGVLPPTPEEAEAMAQPKEPGPQEQMMLAMAQKEAADAKKKEAETMETMADIEKTKAETIQTYSEIELGRLKTAQELANPGQNNRPNA
jgi:hypothetical protein